MAQPHLFSLAHPQLKIKMVTTAFDGMTVSYLRYKVFMEEQKIHIDEEFDGSDAVAVSFLLFFDTTPIGTIRYIKEQNGTYHPGRIAILKAYRGKGYGKALVQWFDQYVLGLEKTASIELHAQQYLLKFYHDLGYRQVGEPFMEANIPHVRMRKTLARLTS
jgi:predicted GNAT family N-acyltransferase